MTPVATALREAKEELGIPPSKVDVWGKLPRLPDRVSPRIPPLISVTLNMYLSWPLGSELSKVLHTSMVCMTNKWNSPVYITIPVPAHLGWPLSPVTETYCIPSLADLYLHLLQVHSTMITPVIGCLHGLELSSLRPNGSEVQVCEFHCS